MQIPRRGSTRLHKTHPHSHPPPSQIAPQTKSSKNHRTCRLQIGRRDDAAAKAGEGREAGQGAPPTIRAYDPPGGRVIADSGAGLSSRPRPGIRVGREMGRRKGAAPGSGFPLPPPKSDSLSPARRALALALPWGGEAKNACSFSCSDAGFSSSLSPLRLIEGEIGLGSFPPLLFAGRPRKLSSIYIQALLSVHVWVLIVYGENAGGPGVRSSDRSGNVRGSWSGSRGDIPRDDRTATRRSSE